MRPVKRGNSQIAYRNVVDSYGWDCSRILKMSWRGKIFGKSQEQVIVWQYLYEFFLDLGNFLDSNNYNLSILVHPTNPFCITHIYDSTNGYTNKQLDLDMCEKFYNGIRDLFLNYLNTTCTTIYKQAAVGLATDMGSFCSYCETPLLGLVEVEHKLPKSDFPFYSIAWDNFLISCGACNTKKGHRPDRDVIGTGRYALPSPKPLLPSVDSQYEAFLPKLYLFPDITSTGNTTFNTMLEAMPLDLQKCASLTGTFSSVVHPYDTNLYISQIDYTNKSVQYGVTGSSGTLLFAQVDFAIPDVMEVSKNMVRLCGLDFTSSSGTYDRRVMNRTIAWFHILGIVSALRSIPSAAIATLFPMNWATLILSSAHIGFYSVWVTILTQFTDPTNTYPNLGLRFIHDTFNGITGPPMTIPPIYPGTNTGLV